MPPLFELRIGDLKQYAYCPRVVYWSYYLPIEKERTFKMEYGAEQHEVLSVLESRRCLEAYGIKEGKRFFHVPLRSERLGMSGLLDMLVVDAEGVYYPVEFKHTSGPIYANHLLQLAGYALLVEERFGTEVKKGFIYRISPEKREGVGLEVTPVRITAKLRQEVLACIEQIREMVVQERMPEPTSRRGRCVDCEFRRFCGDVV
ncbi:MAG TPA: CRISPR-associated protein Cas4 [Chthonomonas sp.]|uniref:CRISPR-associated protein Cas4 n=1 Tax=Chthonomonas sp. TaxID=2282153 RepID=UPI002B4AADBC|nr:CRISPR-associated protein Cas4 [Chthonomonas sp.]HLI47389.1 CRISPR-associated protein Cas4 [Chthonomonas sp.]